MKYADMHAKGVSLIYKYEEGVDVDFNIGLYFFEKLCKQVTLPLNVATLLSLFPPLRLHPHLGP